MVVDHTSRAAQVTPAAVAATSADGVALTGLYLPGEAQTRGTALVTEAPVVALDMRGHGPSAGRNTGCETGPDRAPVTGWNRLALPSMPKPR